MRTNARKSSLRLARRSEESSRQFCCYRGIRLHSGVAELGARCRQPSESNRVSVGRHRRRDNEANQLEDLSFLHFVYPCLIGLGTYALVHYWPRGHPLVDEGYCGNFRGPFLLEVMYEARSRIAASTIRQGTQRTIAIPTSCTLLLVSDLPRSNVLTELLSYSG